MFSEEFKYVAKEKKISEYNTNDIEIFSDDSNREKNSDKENSNKEN